MSFSMIECKYHYSCGKLNHQSRGCFCKDKIPIEEWDINKAKTKDQSHMK